MHVAFHFVENQSLDWPRPLIEVLRGLSEYGRADINTKLFTGTVLFDAPIAEYIGNEHGGIQRVNPDLLRQVIDVWSRGRQRKLWTLASTARRVAQDEAPIFAVAVESVSVSVARDVDNQLKAVDGYLGAGELVETDPIDMGIYMLSPVVRLHDSVVSVFWSGLEGEDKDENLRQALIRAGLGEVHFESLEGRYTIFDALHLPKARLQLAEAKRLVADLLGQVGEDLVVQFSDHAPDFAERLWAILTTLRDAQTSEQCSMVALSCRRLIEFTADCLLPATKGDGSLSGPKYRNRLLAYADRTRSNDTDIDLICATTENLAHLLERLDGAINKGVHASIARRSARRCVIRTLLLVDDLLALRNKPLPMQLKVDDAFVTRLKEHLRGSANGDS